jgi:modulator of FtsH protease HflC
MNVTNAAQSRSSAPGRMGVAAALVLALALAAVAGLCFFTVTSGEFALVTEFGKPVQVVTAPGLGFKYPYQSVRSFDSRIDVYVPAASEFLTLEKTPVVAGAAILWRIADPKRFFETAGSPLSAFVSVEPGAYRAEALLAEVTRKCREVARRDYGIEIAEVKLQSFDFPKQNRPRVYARMASERGQLSMKYRSEGEEAGLKIRSAADGEKSRILTEALKVAQQHRAEGEGEGARIYAEALGKGPDFYRFLRTMEASKNLVPKGTTLVLPADSELFGLLYDSMHYERDSVPQRIGAKPRKERPMR